MMANGDVVLQSGTQDLGTGTYTVMAQFAADEFGLPIERVRFELGDSRLPQAPVSGGSQTVASVGPAVLAACQQARDHLVAMALSDAGDRWAGARPADFHLQDGAVVGPPGRMTVGEMLARRNVGFIDVQADAKPPGKDDKTHSLHAFGAQFAEVRVDPLLGEIRVSRLVGVFDGGRVLNAKTAHSQLIGGMTFGVGMALLEETMVDEVHRPHRQRQHLAEYMVPVNADIPVITATLLDGGRSASPIPVGAKGLGELPMVGMAAAIANAVYHATGVRVRDPTDPSGGSARLTGPCRAGAQLRCRASGRSLPVQNATMRTSHHVLRHAVADRWRLGPSAGRQERSPCVNPGNRGGESVPWPMPSGADLDRALVAAAKGLRGMAEDACRSVERSKVHAQGRRPAARADRPRRRR